jgi:HK97 family phage portal protein
MKGWMRLSSNNEGLVRNQTPMPEIVYGTSMAEVFGIGGSANLPTVTETTAQQVTAINACVNLISGAIASMPVNIFDISANGQRSKREFDNLWWMFNREFSPRWVAHSGWEYLSRSRLFHGDGFAQIIRRGPSIVGLRPHHPSRVMVMPWKDASRLAYRIQPEPWEGSKEAFILDQDDMLHIPGWGFDGIRSVSPLKYALRMAGGVALATQDFSAQFFANQARPDYVLKTDGSLTQEQIDDLRTQVNEKHGRAAGNSGRPMLLQGGLSVQTVSLTNEDAELIATRGFQIEEIARAYGIPPWMIGRGEKASNWGTGLAEQGAGFVRYTLRTHLSAFQNEINRKIFGTPATSAEFDTFELERGDMKSMFEAFRMALGRAGEPGFMTQNEVRDAIYMNRLEGADDLNNGVKLDAQPPA